ncbi:hypothetical protein HYALB_00008990 [Hymenoscyphus albidus]|uniref:Uncharacterized protein n=1 Tax=Hymenoscyphus albidus TaxID=595503 RepID=A0A9N9LME2_9HELO|nr:hypothetical protein HYALB_00008990 [Hymenoscyphus albidus]
MCSGEITTYENCEHKALRITKPCQNPRDECRDRQRFKHQPAAIKMTGACLECQKRYRGPGGGPMNMNGGPAGRRTPTSPQNLNHSKSMAHMNQSYPGYPMGQMHGGGGGGPHTRPPSNSQSIISEQEREIHGLRESLEEVRSKLRDKDKENAMMRNCRPTNLVVKGNESTIMAGLLAPLDEGAAKLDYNLHRVNDGCRRLVTTPPEKMKRKELEAWKERHMSHEIIWDNQLRDEIQKVVGEMKSQMRERLESFLAGMM